MLLAAASFLSIACAHTEPSRPAPVAGAATPSAPSSSAFELAVLGSGGPVSFGRAASGYVVFIDGVARALVDVGPGAFVRLGEMRIDLHRLDTILLTHLHIDHSGDLPGFVKSRDLTYDEPLRFRIFGPGGGGDYPNTTAFVDRMFGREGAFAYLPKFRNGLDVEAEEFGGGYQWGSVRLADVKLAGEVAAKLPVQIVGDPAFNAVPAACSACASPQQSPAELGANGLLGIDAFVYDCGEQCAGADPLPAFYYSCTGDDCTVASAALTEQLTNPIARFEADSNGAVVKFPAVAAGGAVSLAGQLVFGIGTAPNNGLEGTKVLTLDPYGNFTTVFGGQTLTQSFIDSGTNQLLFDDGSIPACPGQLGYLYCPSSPVSLTAENKGGSGVTSTVAFSVENAVTLYSHTSYTAFDDVAGLGGAGTFVWGFPFFIGRSVYVALDGATTPGGKGPYFAY